MLNVKNFFKNHEPLLFFLMVFFLVSPGMVYLFFWHRELFIQLDWVKLSVLSLSMLVPAAFLNALFYLHFENINPSKNGRELVDAFILTAVFSGLSFFVALLAAHFLENLFWSLAITEVILLMVMFRDSRANKEEKS